MSKKRVFNRLFYENKNKGRLTKCSSFRTKATFLKFRNKEGKEKYVDCGCGEVLTCLKCGVHYKERLAGSRRGGLIGIVNSLIEYNKKITFAHWVFTLTKIKNESVQTYNELFSAASKTVKAFFGNIGVVLVLHNWSTQNPEQPHIHIHCFLIGINKEKELVNLFVNESEVKRVYLSFLRQSSIEYDFRKQTVKKTVVDLAYYKSSQMPEIINKINYIYRSPVEDFVKVFGQDKSLTIPFLERTGLLKEVKQRIRNIGCLGNNSKSAFLNSLNIVEDVKDSEIEQEGFVFVGKEQAKEFDDYYLLADGKRISKSEVGNVNSILKYKSYKCVKPLKE